MGPGSVLRWDTLVLPSSRLAAAADPGRSAEDTGDAGTRRREFATEEGKAGRAPTKSPRPGEREEEADVGETDRSLKGSGLSSVCEA